MPVFDFNSAPTEAAKGPECTYKTYRTSAPEASPEQPILLLSNQKRQWKHHSCGVFTNPNKRTAFEFKEEDGKFTADILLIDARFVSLLKWLGEHQIHVRLSGMNREDWLRRIQDPGDCLRRRHQAFCRGRLPAVHDRAAFCQQRPLRGGSGRGSGGSGR